ncbi:Transcriptional regulatory protein WalR [subsurface metagenome]
MPNEKRILVIDDEPHAIRALTFILKKEGYHVYSALNGEEAMARVRESKPDLMFLDVMMPRKNGFEVCQEIKGDPGLSDIYIIMLTAKGQEKDREKGLSLGADEFITKPFSLTDIVARVRELLG